MADDVRVQPSEVGLLGLGLTGEGIAGVSVDGHQPRTERPTARAA
jgi:hypothetical protein